MRPFLFTLLLAAAPAMAQSPDWSMAARVPVDLRSFKYDPSTITLDHGRPYVLHLTNTSSGGHDFVAKGFFAAAKVDETDRAAVHDGRVDVGGGESVDIRLIAPAPGRYEVHCSHFLHSTFGMKGTIVVH